MTHIEILKDNMDHAIEGLKTCVPREMIKSIAQKELPVILNTRNHLRSTELLQKLVKELEIMVVKIDERSKTIIHARNAFEEGMR